MNSREADTGKIDKRDLTEAEERDLIESSERGEWLPVGNIEEQRAFWKQAARQTLDAKAQADFDLDSRVRSREA